MLCPKWSDFFALVSDIVAIIGSASIIYTVLPLTTPESWLGLSMVFLSCNVYVFGALYLLGVFENFRHGFWWLIPGFSHKEKPIIPQRLTSEERFFPNTQVEGNASTSQVWYFWSVVNITDYSSYWVAATGLLILILKPPIGLSLVLIVAILYLVDVSVEQGAEQSKASGLAPSEDVSGKFVDHSNVPDSLAFYEPSGRIKKRSQNRLSLPLELLELSQHKKH